MEKEESNEKLARKNAFECVFRPFLESSEWPDIREARELIAKFNAQNGTALTILDMFHYTVEPEEALWDQPVIIEQPTIIVKAAQLAVTACKTGLMDPHQREKHGELKNAILVANKAIKAWSP